MKRNDTFACSNKSIFIMFSWTNEFVTYQHKMVLLFSRQFSSLLKRKTFTDAGRVIDVIRILIELWALCYTTLYHISSLCQLQTSPLLASLLEKCSKMKIILKLYFAFQIINLIQKVNCQHQWNLYTANVTKNGFLRQVEQGFSSFFAIFY